MRNVRTVHGMETEVFEGVITNVAKDLKCGKLTIRITDPDWAGGQFYFADSVDEHWEDPKQRGVWVRIIRVNSLVFTEDLRIGTVVELGALIIDRFEGPLAQCWRVAQA